MGLWDWFAGNTNENTLTTDELATIIACEEYYKTPGIGVEHPESGANQQRMYTLLQRGVYMEENAYGDWVWHKKVEPDEEE